VIKESNVLVTTAMIGGIPHYNLIIELSTILKDPKDVQKCLLLLRIVVSYFITYWCNCIQIDSVPSLWIKTLQILVLWQWRYSIVFWIFLSVISRFRTFKMSFSCIFLVISLLFLFSFPCLFLRYQWNGFQSPFWQNFATLIIPFEWMTESFTVRCF
jgi:hypothetical protein